MFNPPQDMVIRDSFVYCVEGRRLQIVNVARPREPVLVGSCVLPDQSYGMCLRDSLAYVTNWPLEIVNVSNPANPTVIGSIWRGAWNIFVKDTLAYIAGGNGLFTYSVADLSSPYLIDSSAWSSNVFDAVVVDTLAYVSCRDGVRLLSVADPANPRLLGFLSTPYDAWRITYSAPHLYVACQEAGVCILETLPVGIVEPKNTGAQPPRNTCAGPSVARDYLWIRRCSGMDAAFGVYDHAGRRQVLSPTCVVQVGHRTRLDVRGLSAGVYFVRFHGNVISEVVKFVKP
jgi:hypothetical protein